MDEIVSQKTWLNELERRARMFKREHAKCGKEIKRLEKQMANYARQAEQVCKLIDDERAVDNASRVV